jgi:DnaJ-class molecular chaperone
MGKLRKLITWFRDSQAPMRERAPHAIRNVHAQAVAASRDIEARICAHCGGDGTIPVPKDEPGRFGKATHLTCAHCGGTGRRDVRASRGR